MNREVRERLILPFVIPIGAMAFIAALVFLLSRVLLAAPREVAVAVALMVAINILVVCALLAIPPRGLRVNPLLVVAVALAPLALGVVSTGVVEEGIDQVRHDGAAAQVIEIAAVNIAFDKSQLTLSAERKAVVKFNNRDAGVPHNVGIFAGKDASGEKVFTGEVFPGPRSVEYRVPSLAAGSYFFRCDVHPTVMIGTIAVLQMQAAPAASGPFRTAVSANKIAFNTNELSIPSGVRALLEFNNQEPVPHNVGIFKGTDATGEKVFTGDVITGPREIVYAILPLAPGTYFFRCDIHPATMKGSIKVA